MTPFLCDDALFFDGCLGRRAGGAPWVAHGRRCDDAFLRDDALF